MTLDIGLQSSNFTSIKYGLTKNKSFNDIIQERMYTMDFQNTNVLKNCLESIGTYFMKRGIVLRALLTIYLNSFPINFDEYSFLISCEKFVEFYILNNLYYLQ